MVGPIITTDKEELIIRNHISLFSLASRLNGYMHSNGTSLNVALFILMANHLAWCILA